MHLRPLAATACCFLVLGLPGSARETEEKGSRHVIDLTQPLNANTPTYLGTSGQWRYEKLTDLEHNGYQSGAFRTPEHFGTHVDAPVHFFKDADSVDKLDVQHLVGDAVVIDIRADVASNPDYELSVERIKGWERAGKVPPYSTVLLLTGWSSRFNQPEKYRNPDAAGVMHFPGFSPAAVEFLVNERHVSALGTDTLSIDPGASKSFAAHKYGLGHGLYFMECLTNLDQLPSRGATLFCGPLKIENGTGSPARVLAVTRR